MKAIPWMFALSLFAGVSFAQGLGNNQTAPTLLEGTKVQLETSSGDKINAMVPKKDQDKLANVKSGETVKLITDFGEEKLAEE